MFCLKEKTRGVGAFFVQRRKKAAFFSINFFGLEKKKERAQKGGFQKEEKAKTPFFAKQNKERL